MQLHYLSSPPKKSTTEKSPAIILLHGRGSDEQDLFSLSPYLDERLHIYSIQAPYKFEFSGYTWFDLNMDGSIEIKRFEKSYLLLKECIDEIRNLPAIDSNKIFLLGFSMGAMMSYMLALTQPEKFSGVIAHSGFVPEQLPLHYQWNASKSPSFFITHGIDDPVIPISFARNTKKLFEKSSIDFLYKEYSMGHQINEECLADAMQWLKNKI